MYQNISSMSTILLNANTIASTVHSTILAWGKTPQDEEARIPQGTVGQPVTGV
jgi:hypothetical protein